MAVQARASATREPPAAPASGTCRLSARPEPSSEPSRATPTRPETCPRLSPHVETALRDVVRAGAVDQAEQPEVVGEVVIRSRDPRDLPLAAGFEPDVRRAGDLRAPQRGDRAHLAGGGEKLA